jgi:16S rRNA (cytidine1402-2'-O)-methyltransferase
MLYIVATPIGNLEDITYRAVKILSSVDLILAEDTRHSRKLLDHYGIQTPMKAYHEHNEAELTPILIQELSRGKTMALISDAGTPLISDPGFDLIRAAREKGLVVSPIPGPCAAIAALSATGLPTDKFTFAGFLPHKSAAKRTRLEHLKAMATTLIFYESPHRLLETLADIQGVFGENHPILLAKELTKQFERFFYGPLKETLALFEKDPKLTQGEFVLLVAPLENLDSERVDISTDQALKELSEALPKAKAAEIVAKWTGVPKRDFYKKLVSLETQ